MAFVSVLGSVSVLEASKKVDEPLFLVVVYFKVVKIKSVALLYLHAIVRSSEYESLANSCPVGSTAMQCIFLKFT